MSDQLEVFYEGWNGAVFDLRRGEVRIGEAGIAGLLRVPSTTFVRTSPVVDGQEVTGWKANPRSIMFPVDVSSDAGGLGFLATDRAFRKAIRPDRAGLLTVQAPDGRARSISVRLSDDADDGALEGDPIEEAGYVTVVDLIADKPWWLGPEVAKEFTVVSAPQYGFYGPTGAGPSFYLAAPSFTGRSTITNPGDVDAWPVWEIHGPATNFRLEVDGQIISSSINIDEGQRLVIDTDPERASLRLYNENGTYSLVPYHQMSSIRFARIRDGSEVTVFVLVSGGGSARVSFRPKYFGAY